MEISKEILLIDDVLQDEPFSEKNLIQLIRDICQGLDIPLSCEEQKFLQTKISYYLFCLAAKQGDRFKILCRSLVTPHAKLLWHTLFHICIESNVISAFFELLVENLPKKTLHLVIETYCEEIVRLDYNDVMASLCSLTTVLLQRPDESISALLNNFLESLSRQYDVQSFFPVADCHIRVLQQAIQSLEKANKKKNMNSLDLVVLKRLQKLSVLDISDDTVRQNAIESLKKPVSDAAEDDCRFINIAESSEHFQNFILSFDLLIGKHLRKLQDLAKKSSSVQDYCYCLAFYKTKLSAIFEANSDSRINDKVINDCPDWNMKSALFCATNLLKNYNEAVEYILSRLADDNLAHSVANNCLKKLCDVPECMVLTRHVTCLCNVIKLFWHTEKNANVNENIRCATELLVKVFALLPVSSKLALVGRRCDEKQANLSFHHRALQLHCNNVDNLQRNLNLVFNKMTKTDEKVDFDIFLRNVCNVAFIAPQLVVKKIVEHIACHEENHVLLLKLFESITTLLKIESDQQRSMLLIYLVQRIEENAAKDNAIQSICKFISLLLNTDSLKSFFGQYFTTQMLRVYVFPKLSAKHIFSTAERNLSVEFSLNLIECVSHIFAEVETFTLIVVAYHLARLVDEFAVSDGLLSHAKTILIELVDTVISRVQNEKQNGDVLCNWLKNVTKSLSWSTQLYFRPLLKNGCKEYNILLPECLKHVCVLPEGENICLDSSYGEGTGLTAWLQCLVVDPTFLPLASLNIQDLSQEEQKIFKHGLVIALSQVLPFCLEEDWNVILEILNIMLNERFLYVAYPLDHLKALPFLNLRNFRNSLCILELLHQVTIILQSRCCSSWMLGSLWSRFARCSVIALKRMLCWDSLSEDEIEKVQQQAFFLCQMFYHCCDLLIMLESLRDCDGARDSIFVLLLDVVTQFCAVYDRSQGLCNSIVSEITSLHSLLLSYIENISSGEMQKALLKKLTFQL